MNERSFANDPAAGGGHGAGGGEPSGGPGGEAFEVRELVGQGGMGMVFRAIQASLGREVAVKRATRRGARALAQFVAEAQITGRLEHANIVPVHLLGRAPDGSPQIAMKLVRGTSWRALLHGEPKTARERAGAGRGAGDPEAGRDLKDHLAILLAVCNAVAFAHERGIIHRDLKPDNVMVGEFGQVFLMDWGLALPLERARAARSPSGTPAYMAPELAAGDGAAQGPATDVYLLGACLHEVLTRRRRHEGDSVYGVLLSSIESAPFRYDPSVPAELAYVANRATAADPAERFASVAEFRRAVEAYLEHREAYAIADKGAGLVDDLRAAIAAFPGAPPAERGERARAIDRLHVEARAAFGNALAIWPGAELARAGLREASRLVLGHALATEDLPLATRVAPECEDPAAAGGVEELRRRLAARESELVELREEARRHDWSAVAGPLGTVFFAAAFLGGAGAAASRWSMSHPDVPALYHPRVPWISLCFVIGAFAFVKLRRARLAGSLVSPRVLGTWAAVAVACALTGIAAEVRGSPPFQDACYQAWMIGVGFTAMGFETQRWLLLPALAFFAGGGVMAVAPAYNPEVFGSIWFAVFSAVGYALKKAARDG